jgi:type IV secretory pathway VirB2 component (pilin)
VNDWSDFFLGTIAVATLLMALIQVGAIMVATRLARQAQQTLTEVHREIRPLIAKVSAVADEASRTATVASAQVQKIDRLITDLSRRVDETATVIQEAIVTPAREGVAIIAAVKAGLSALRGIGDLRRSSARSDEEDPLFIG